MEEDRVEVAAAGAVDVVLVDMLCGAGRKSPAEELEDGVETDAEVELCTAPAAVVELLGGAAAALEVEVGTEPEPEPEALLVAGGGATL